RSTVVDNDNSGGHVLAVNIRPLVRAEYCLERFLRDSLLKEGLSRGECGPNAAFRMAASLTGLGLARVFLHALASVRSEVRRGSIPSNDPRWAPVEAAAAAS